MSDILDSPAAGSAAVRGGILRIGGYGVGVLVTVIGAALLFRHLGVADAGKFVTVMSLVTLVAGLTDAGLVALGVRELAVRDGDDRRQFLRDLLGLRLVLTTAGLLPAVAFALLAGYEQAMVLGVLLGGAALLLQAAQSTIATVLTASLRLGWVTAIELLRQVLVTLLTAGLVVAGAELLAFLAIPLPVSLIVLTVTVVVVREQAALRAALAPARWARLLRDAALYAMATAVFALYFKVAILLLGLVADERQTGLFAASFRIVDVLVVIPQLAVGAAFPIMARAARDDPARLAYGVQRTFEASLLLGAGIAVLLGVGAPFAIEVVAGGDFEEAATVLRIQSVAVGAAFVAAVWGYTLVSLRRDRAFLLMAVVPTLALAVSTLLLGAEMGAEGAALATVIGELTLVALGAIAVRMTTGVRLHLGRVPGIVLATALALGWAFVPGLPSVAAAALAGLTFAAVALVTRSVPGELFAALRR